MQGIRIKYYLTFFKGIVLLFSVSVFSGKIDLRENWYLQSGAVVSQAGDIISTDTFQCINWYEISVPTTVLAALIEKGEYKNVFYSDNLKNIPLERFTKPWWYRTEFILPVEEKGKRIFLNFKGINYRADIWLNGMQIADSKEVVGTFRTYEFDITGQVKFEGKTNVLACKVVKPERDDLTLYYVDWAPAPPDLNMGLHRNVFIKTGGLCKIRHPYVKTELDLPSINSAKLTVYADITNRSDSTVKAEIFGNACNVSFSKSVSFGSGETKTVSFSYKDFPQLNISNPDIWWPWHMGEQPLCNLELSVKVDGKVSDKLTEKFGIRQVTSEFNEKGYRIFSVNGKRVLIKGAGWCPDLFQRIDPVRQESEIKYVRDMNLNTIRLEGKLENENFYDLCDKYGILVMAGWCCGLGWEQWGSWKDEDYLVAYASQRDQIYRLRKHPCVFVWLNGSDRVPYEKVEKSYLDILDKLNWQNPILSSATSQSSSISGKSGVKMTGPYEWVPPLYWLTDTRRGGAFGFNTETGPGPAVPPLESMKKMIPEKELWPINNYWNFHCGLNAFSNVNIFTKALNGRYGESQSALEYCVKAQVAAYESHRAMFEGFSGNKYTSTGVIQWMLNNAWPSLIWHLYDYFLCPGGSYFGAKKGCEPLHIQYSYDNQSVDVVNSWNRDFNNLQASASLYNIDGKMKSMTTVALSIKADETKKLFIVPSVNNLTSTYFLRLTLKNSKNELKSINTYWMSTTPDVLNHKQATWYYTPVSSYCDFTALKRLPVVEVNYSIKIRQGYVEDTANVTVTNPTDTLAFAVHLKLVRSTDKSEILPILWDDNYFVLFPHETRTISARYSSDNLNGALPLLNVEGWNVKNSQDNIIQIKHFPDKHSLLSPNKYQITIYNLMGRKVFEHVYKKNIHSVGNAIRNNDINFFNRNIASGLYLVKIKMFYNRKNEYLIFNEKMMLKL